LFLWWFLDQAAERLPFWELLPSPPAISLPLLFGLSALWFASPSSFKASPRFRSLIIMGVLMIAGLCFLPRAGPPGPWFAFLDVGQGDAAVCRLSDGTVWIIDAGDDRGPADAAYLSILPFLRRQRIRRVDGLILSHRHRDHVGGLATLLETVPVRQVFDAGHGGIRGTPGWVDSVLAEHGQVACLVASGDTLHASGEVTIVALHPGRSDPLQDHSKRNLNDASLVVRLQDGSMSILFVGDAEQEAEESLLRERHLLRSRVLKVGHHGSRTSSSMAFLEAVSPEFAVISCGEGNRFSHPAGKTLASLDSLGIAVHRTDRDGSTLVSIGGGELRIEIHPPRPVIPPEGNTQVVGAGGL
jgi:competence protein ComEC